MPFPLPSTRARAPCQACFFPGGFFLFLFFPGERAAPTQVLPHFSQPLTRLQAGARTSVPVSVALVRQIPCLVDTREQAQAYAQCGRDEPCTTFRMAAIRTPDDPILWCTLAPDDPFFFKVRWLMKETVVPRPSAGCVIRGSITNHESNRYPFRRDVFLRDGCLSSCTAEKQISLEQLCTRSQF